MRIFQRRNALAVCLTLPLAACGDGATSTGIANGTGALAPSTARPSAARTKNGAAFTIRIPPSSSASRATLPAHPGILASGTAAKRPQYVSVNTASATITLTNVNGATAPAGYPAVTAALTRSSPNCSNNPGVGLLHARNVLGGRAVVPATPAGTLTCSVSVPAPPGEDAFTITLLDAAAHPLSTNSETVAIAAGQTSTAQPLVLNGIAASYAITPADDAPTSVHVSASGSGYRILGMLPYDFSIEPVDASGATIIGPGAPAVTLTSTSSAVTATALTGLSYAIKVVEQSAAAVALTAQSTGGATLAVPIVTAPEYFVCDAAGSAIRAYDIDGTTATPIAFDDLLLSNGVILGGIAIDGAGNIWVSDENSGVKSYAPGSTTALSNISVAAPWQIAFAPSGTLYAESYISPQMYLEGFNASSGALETTSSAVGATDDGPLAIDSLGQLWFGDEYDTNTVKGYTNTGAQIGALTFSGLTPNALAFDSSGHLWMGSSSAISAYNTATGALIAGSTITSGVATPAAIRFDPAGNIIELDAYDATMHVYSPSGSLLRTIVLPNVTGGNISDMAIAP